MNALYRVFFSADEIDTICQSVELFAEVNREQQKYALDSDTVKDHQSEICNCARIYETLQYL